MGWRCTARDWGDVLARLGVEIQQIAYSDAGGRVSLSFNHACAAIQFKIGQSKTLAYKSVTFNSITLVDVYKSGKYYYNQTPAWQEQSGNAYYTLEDATSIEVPVSTTTHDGARSLDCGCLFMIPQAHSNAKSTLSIIPIKPQRFHWVLSIGRQVNYTL